MQRHITIEDIEKVQADYKSLEERVKKIRQQYPEDNASLRRLDAFDNKIREIKSKERFQVLPFRINDIRRTGRNLDQASTNNVLALQQGISTLTEELKTIEQDIFIDIYVSPNKPLPKAVNKSQEQEIPKSSIALEASINEFISEIADTNKALVANVLGVIRAERNRINQISDPEIKAHANKALDEISHSVKFELINEHIETLNNDKSMLTKDLQALKQGQLSDEQVHLKAQYISISREQIGIVNDKIKMATESINKFNDTFKDAFKQEELRQAAIAKQSVKKNVTFAPDVKQAREPSVPASDISINAKLTWLKKALETSYDAQRSGNQKNYDFLIKYMELKAAIESKSSSKQEIRHCIMQFNNAVQSSNMNSATKQIIINRIQNAENNPGLRMDMSAMDKSILDNIGVTLKDTAALKDYQEKLTYINDALKVIEGFKLHTTDTDKFASDNKRGALLSARVEIAEAELKRSGDIHKVNAILNGDYDTRNKNLLLKQIRAMTSFITTERSQAKERIFNGLKEFMVRTENSMNERSHFYKEEHHLKPRMK